MLQNHVAREVRDARPDVLANMVRLSFAGVGESADWVRGMIAVASRPPHRLPSVGQVMESSAAAMAVARYGRQATVAAVRALVSEFRRRKIQPPDAEILGERVLVRLEIDARPRLKPIFNLTGVILHTNLGRAVLAESAISAALEAMRRAVALEFDLDSGGRGERDDHLRDLICELTGAEDATVVNNNAAAVLLVLNSLACRKESVVSRGELIEIGGAFRLPQIMSGASTKLKEVGTTNRTHQRDYAEAVGPRTALFLKVHTSNYVIKGFASEVATRDLSAIAKKAGVPLVCDLGSGTLIGLERFGLAHEATVMETLGSGADLVTFSGDKLLGGPQAGFIVGKRALIEKINNNPMKRAMRVDKIRLAALEATLQLYRNPDAISERVPTFRLIARSRDVIGASARRVAAAITSTLAPLFEVAVMDCESEIGSGSLPMQEIASVGIVIRSTAKGGGRHLERLSAALRGLPIPVVGRMNRKAIVLDMRCLDDEDGFISNFQRLTFMGPGA
jgi:L-seryl-tRNA(Ser) seleniumtransferase